MVFLLLDLVFFPHDVVFLNIVLHFDVLDFFFEVFDLVLLLRRGVKMLLVLG